MYNLFTFEKLLTRYGGLKLKVTLQNHQKNVKKEGISGHSVGYKSFHPFCVPTLSVGYKSFHPFCVPNITKHLFTLKIQA